MRRLVPLLLVAGCAVLDRQEHTRFDPYPNGFHYVVRVDERFPEDSKEAERARMAWLDYYLQRDGLCPGGYTLTLRRLIDKPDLGEEYIYYVGVCNAATVMPDSVDLER
jgi:hypothetical protein